MRQIYILATFLVAIGFAGMNAAALSEADWTELDPSFQGIAQDNRNLMDKDADLQAQIDGLKNGSTGKEFSMESDDIAFQGSEPLAGLENWDKVSIKAKRTAWSKNQSASANSSTKEDAGASAGSDSQFEPSVNPVQTMVQPSISTMAAQPVVTTNAANHPVSSTQTIITSSSSSATWTWGDMNGIFHTTEPSLKAADGLPNWKVALLYENAPFQASFREAVLKAWNEQSSNLKDEYETPLGQPGFVGI